MKIIMKGKKWGLSHAPTVLPLGHRRVLTGINLFHLNHVVANFKLSKKKRSNINSQVNILMCRVVCWHG